MSSGIFAHNCLVLVNLVYVVRSSSARDSAVERAVSYLSPALPAAADNDLHARKDALIGTLQGELAQLKAHLQE